MSDPGAFDALDNDPDNDLDEGSDSEPLDEPDEEPDEGSIAQRAASRVNAVLTALFVGLPGRIGRGTVTFFGALSAPIPLSGKLWHALTMLALHNYHKAAGGDRMGLEELPNGSVELTPVKYKSMAETEPEEAPGWHAKGKDKTWKETTEGPQSGRLGKVPVLPLDSDSWQNVTTYQARIAEAVDQGQTRPVYDVGEAELTAVLQQTGSNQPVADGGYAVTDIQFDPRDSPIFADTIIELGNEDYDGSAIAWSKAKELFAETTTEEEMWNQEKRGELAGRAHRNFKKFALRIFLYAALVALGGLVGPELVAAIFGGGGGGGGSVVPISAEMALGLI